MAAKIGSNRADTVLVTTPSDMATVLFNASARSAGAYALAAQKEAGDRGDQKRVHFWDEVGRELQLLQEELGHAA